MIARTGARWDSGEVAAAYRDHKKYSMVATNQIFYRTNFAIAFLGGAELGAECYGYGVDFGDFGFLCFQLSYEIGLYIARSSQL